jgi:hypothetical protein
MEVWAYVMDYRGIEMATHRDALRGMFRTW